MTTALIERPSGNGFNGEQLALIKQTIAKGASDQELALFIAQCSRTGLDPFSRQIYWIKRGTQGSTQVSIDGFRVIAERSGEMDGQDVSWCDGDGIWRDVWLETKAPAAARVLVYRKGCSKPFPGIAKWSEYAQSSPLWAKMASNQLAKCAEALALRKAFPHQLSGLYTPDEMEQASAPALVVTALEPPIDRETGEELPPPPTVEGSVYITRVESKPTSRPSVTKHAITFSDGMVASTINDRLSALCEQLAQDRAAVFVETKDTRWGLDVVKVERVRPPADEPRPLTDADIF